MRLFDLVDSLAFAHGLSKDFMSDERLWCVVCVVGGWVPSGGVILHNGMLPEWQMGNTSPSFAEKYTNLSE